MKRILVRAPNWIGDQVLAFPFYYHLRKSYPDAWIAVVCTEWVKDIQFRGLVDELFILPKNKNDNFFRSFRNIQLFSKKVKSRGPWDLGIVLPNSFGSALLFKMAGVRERRGYDTDARGFLLTQKLSWNPGHEIHRAQAYQNLLHYEGLPACPAQEFWKFSKEKQFDPIHYWPDIVPIEPPRRPYFIIAPGATADSRRWSVEQFGQLIEKIAQKFDYQAVIVGGNAEKEIASQLYRKGYSVEDYTARGWVAAHWKLFREAKFTVCNESGLAHVASLCGSKVQIVCGAADPRRTKPIGPGKVQVKVNPIECWPCEKNQCQFQDARKNQCHVGISAEQVFEEVSRGLLTP